MTAWLSEALVGPRVVVRATASGDMPALAGEPLIAVTQEANIRSIRLLERAGAQHTSTFEQYGLPQRQYEFRL
jgi:hypothetical protein